MSRLTSFSLIGAVVTAICCFTPLLVWAFAAIGLAGAIAYLDLVLLPLLGVFLALTVWGILRGRQSG